MGRDVIRLIVRYKALKKCDCGWFHNENYVRESSNLQIFHDEIALHAYQFGLEIYGANDKSGGVYNCMVNNEHGELQVQLALNIEGESEFGQNTSNMQTYQEPKEPRNVEKKRPKVQVQEYEPQVQE